jgi:hypothetical protein
MSVSKCADKVGKNSPQLGRILLKTLTKSHDLGASELTCQVKSDNWLHFATPAGRHRIALSRASGALMPWCCWRDFRRCFERSWGDFFRY